MISILSSLGDTPAEQMFHGAALLGRGMYLDLPPWGVHLFRVEGGWARAASPGVESRSCAIPGE